MKRHLMAGSIGFVIFCAGIFALYVSSPTELAREYLVKKSQITITVGKSTFRVTSARTESERARGLMHVTNLADDQGMLFVFERRATQTFWNKDTKLSLIVVWIDGEKVIGLSELPSDASGVRLVASPASVTHVLELPRVSMLAQGIKIGDSVRINE